MKIKDSSVAYRGVRVGAGEGTSMSTAEDDSINATEQPTNEGSATVTFPHTLQLGFPKSMLAPAEGGNKLIALLRKRGLTTSLMKQVLARPWVRKMLGKTNGHRDNAIVELLSNPYLRADCFVWTAERRPVAQYYFSLSPEFAILSAFAPEWPELALDEEVLRAECERWDEIRQGLKKGAFEDAQASTFGVFMLWPRIRGSLESWGSLSAAEREATSHAAFAISTLAKDEWFIGKAIELVPELKEDLGGLLSPFSAAKADGSMNGEAVPQEEASTESETTLTTDLTMAWKTIGEELASLSGEWGDTPRRGLLERLIALSNSGSDLIAEIPEDKKPPRALLQAGLAALRSRLLELAIEEVMSWLTSDVIDQVMARWDLQRAVAADDQALLDLVDDTDVALSRVEVAFAEMQAAETRFIETRQAVQALESELANRTSAIRKLELAKRSLQAREESIDAERKRTDVMLFVLASASPHGEVFDPAVDYLAEATQESTIVSNVNDESVDPVIDTEPNAAAVAADTAPPNQVTEETALNEPIGASNPVPPSLVEDVEVVDQEPTAATPVHMPKPVAEAPCAVIADPPHELAAAPGLSISVGGSAAPTPNEKLGDVLEIQPAQVFSETTDARCRPIWLLLQQDKPSLAFQFAAALQSVAPQIRVPHPSLLRSVALAPGLTTSDGPLAGAIGESLAEIEAAWFEPGGAPSNWCIALNLLLIAATLRPMVLAPLTSASTIAAYRHLDGRHSAVLQLVKSVADLSERLTRFSIGPSVLRSAADESSLRAQVAKLSKVADDWLYERAPNKKIRYAPASKVWLYWLRPGEPIHALISPVSSGLTAERSAVKAAIDQLSDYNQFNAILAETDRRKLNRRGPDIEAGALEHLWVATCEAVEIAKEWLATAELLTESGDQLRALVGQLQLVFQEHAGSACQQLEQPWEGDECGQVRAASRVLVKEVKAIADMFVASDAIPVAEPMAKEILARDLLWVPGAYVSDGWAVESEGTALVQALTAWTQSPISTEAALTARVAVGDVAGAELLLPYVSDDRERTLQAQAIERAKEQWLKDLQRKLLQARRDTEVGLAYGYLNDTERAACESELSALEVGLRDTGRFDEGESKVAAIQARIDAYKAHRVQQARLSFERERPRLTEDVANQVEVPLARSDIHTFNEVA